jgi:hypothetical protein
VTGSRPAAGLGFLAGLAAVALLVSPAAQAAPQPSGVPGDFRNGQDNAFGAVAMVPYLQADGGEPVTVEARVWLRDLDTVRRANDLLFAFNLKGDAAAVTFDSLTTAGGTVLVPTQTATVDRGRQPQAHFAPADLLAVAGDGSQPLELVLRGHVEPEANGQVHVGAMVIAFDDGWVTLATSDGPAQLYGFTLLMASGIAGGAMPFQGQGNTAWVLPIAALTVIVALAGASAVSALRRAPAPTPLPPPARPVVFASPASARVGPSAAIPVFGGPASVPAAPVRAAGALPIQGPIQGPLAPPAAARPAAARPGQPVRPAVTPGPSLPARPASMAASKKTPPGTKPHGTAKRTPTAQASKSKAQVRAGSAGRPRQG